MALKSRRRNKKTTQKNVLSVKMQSQQTRRERLRWLRSVVALAVALVALVLLTTFWPPRQMLMRLTSDPPCCAHE